MAAAILPLITPTIRSRLDAKIIKSATGCWGWAGAKTLDGYGQLWVARRPMLAHRISFAVHTGSEPGEMVVAHRCDNPACCNPDHLFLASQRQNLLDMGAKGRLAACERHGRSKLTDDDVQAIRDLLARGHSGNEIAARFGVSQPLISHINTGRIWKRLAPQAGR